MLDRVSKLTDLRVYLDTLAWEFHQEWEEHQEFGWRFAQEY